MHKHIGRRQMNAVLQIHQASLTAWSQTRWLLPAVGRPQHPVIINLHAASCKQGHFAALHTRNNINGVARRGSETSHQHIQAIPPSSIKFFDYHSG